MIRSILIVGAAATLGTAAISAELATTVRPTELKAKPFSDAATVASLAEASKVDVLLRQASWMQVKSDKTTGWVKMLSLRFDALSTAPAKGVAMSNLSTVYQIASTGVGGSTPTTGVKGISEEALKNPRPNPTAFKQMVELEVSPADVASFAKGGKLSAKTMEYLPAPVVAAAAPDAGAKK